MLRICEICQWAATTTQIIADLPAARVRPSHPFSLCGVDYAGSFQLRNRAAVELHKNAVHMKLVSELSTAAFMAALKGFVSRRGRPCENFSDCGTNFSDNLQQIVGSYLTHQGISLYFNSPAAPHQRWDAEVKSIKFHLYRVVVLTMIEACLNSHPLAALSSDLVDLSTFTPGLFQIGDSLLAIPEAGEPLGKLNHVARWQLVQLVVEPFWQHWSSEYLSRLQNLPKWWIKKRQSSHWINCCQLSSGSLAVFPGVDGLVQTATVKTASGEYKRPVIKTVPLPFQDLKN
ncbi:hypothetical protein PR048_012458, partial [Dryococelus australis]